MRTASAENKKRHYRLHKSIVPFLYGFIFDPRSKVYLNAAAVLKEELDRVKV